MAPSAGARAGLTGAMKALALDVARYNVTVNNLLPERFDTDRQIQMAKAAMARDNISYEEARASGGEYRRQAARRSERVRRDLRVSMQCLRRLHVRAEYSPRWRIVSGAGLTPGDVAVFLANRVFQFIGARHTADTATEHNDMCHRLLLL